MPQCGINSLSNMSRNTNDTGATASYKSNYKDGALKQPNTSEDLLLHVQNPPGG